MKKKFMGHLLIPEHMVYWHFERLWGDILKKWFHVLHINIFSATSRQTWSGKYLETPWCVRWSRDVPDTICLRIYGNIAILPIENREIGDNSINTKANRIGFIARSNNETGAYFLFTASRLTACCRKNVDMQIVKPFFQNIAPQRSKCRYTMCSGTAPKLRAWCNDVDTFEAKLSELREK